MIRSEYYFFNKPCDDLIDFVYNEASIEYNDGLWTVITNSTKSDAYTYVNIGECILGDKIVVEVDTIQDSNDLMIGIRTGSTTPTTYILNKHTTIGTGSKKIVFEITQSGNYFVLLGVLSKIGRASFSNIKIRKDTRSSTTSTTSTTSTAKDKLIAVIQKNDSSWDIVEKSGSDNCTITEVDTRQLKIQFEQKLSKTYPACFINLSYQGNDNKYVPKFAYTGVNSVCVKFQDITTGNFLLLSDVLNSTRFNLMII